jgi:hypothetical protein
VEHLIVPRFCIKTLIDILLVNILIGVKCGKGDKETSYYILLKTRRQAQVVKKFSFSVLPPQCPFH